MSQCVLVSHVEINHLLMMLFPLQFFMEKKSEEAAAS